MRELEPNQVYWCVRARDLKPEDTFRPAEMHSSSARVADNAWRTGGKVDIFIEGGGTVRLDAEEFVELIHRPLMVPVSYL